MSGNGRVNVTWDSDSKAVYVYFSDKPVHHTEDYGSVNVDVDANDLPVGVELLSQPVGVDNTPLRAAEWVTVTLAWSIAVQNFGFHGRCGSFTLVHPGRVDSAP